MRNYLIGCSIFAALFGASVVSVRAVPAGGEPIIQETQQHAPCAPLQAILAAATKQYHEHIVFDRMTFHGYRLILTVSEKTFSLMASKPDGSVACILDTEPPAAAGPPAPAPGHHAAPVDPDMQEQHL